VTKKATNTLAFLRRNISSCPRHIRETSYGLDVGPTVSGVCIDCGIPCIKSQIKAVGAVQCRAARYIMADYSKTATRPATRVFRLTDYVFDPS
jgi:hypothetical protein